MDVNNNWRFCVVGNIKTQYTDETGKILYGTKVFSGGTKVYINDKTWGLNIGRITVMGLNRFDRYTTESVPVSLVENVRTQRIFKPKVLETMHYLEVIDGWSWRERTAEDRKAVNAFVENWNSLSVLNGSHRLV